MIKLNDLEKSIFDILLGANGTQKCGSIIRVAGGWIRDKLIGRESDDIDICVDNMSGLEFAKKVILHLGIEDKVGVIKSNPDKSKHIETAVLKVLDTEIQFTGFRKETYDQSSRIPKVEKGDLLEETYRRDFTINSLYYNINTGQVEDISEQGVEDLNNKIIRLMVPPKKLWGRFGINNIYEANRISFYQDPLRILRAIRFACRFDFKLDDNLIEAAKDKISLESFRKKVSRERIQIEIRKILSGKTPYNALQLMKDFNILYDIFVLPDNFYSWDMDQNTPHHEFTVWEHTMMALKNLQYVMHGFSIDNNDDRFIMNLAMFLHDTGKLNPNIQGKKRYKNKIKTTYYGHEKSSVECAEFTLTQLPGIRTDEIKRVQRLIEGSSKVNPNYVPTNQLCNLKNKTLGKFVRLMKDDWKNAILIHMADVTSKSSNSLINGNFTYHADMERKIKILGVKKTINMKPILDGNEIISLIGKPAGPWISKVISKLIEWQLEKQKYTKEDAIVFVKSFKNNV